MGRMKQYLDMISQSRLLCPNLKEMTLRVYTGNAHRGNSIARSVVRDHLLALRWCNPNAVIYLREARGQGTPFVEYELWKPTRSFKASSTTKTPTPIALETAASDAPSAVSSSATREQEPESLSRIVIRQMGSFEISHSLTPEEVVAKVMMAGRDPDDDDDDKSISSKTTLSTEKVNDKKSKELR